MFFLSLVLLPAAVQAEWFNGAEDIMGTQISVELWQDDPTLAQIAIDAVMAEMRAVNQSMSPYIESSELYQINQHAAKQPVVISAELFALIQKSLYYSKLSNGAFDISFASVGRFYDYRKAELPAEQQLADMLPAINYHLIELNPTAKTIRFHHPQLNIDLGGIAKGFAVDKAISRLKSLGVESAIVSAGGDSRILGDRRGNPWVVGIKHPRKDDGFVVRIPLVNSAISTSGDYERFFIKANERIHHIINPTTGKSAAAVQSVSILAPLAVDSDALSTTVFVLGVKKGLALINRFNGIDAIIIDADGRLHYSDDLLRATQS
ncbi:MAG: FAD:protein FMN transferase [Spongiibacteraceae bacterium]